MIAARHIPASSKRHLRSDGRLDSTGSGRKHGRISTGLHSTSVDHSPHAMPSPDHVLFQSLADHAGMLVMELDPHGNIIWASRAVEKATGHSLLELRGQEWTSLLVPEHLRATSRQLCSTVQAQQNESRRHELPLLTDDGTLRYVEWHFSALRGTDGDGPRLLCIGRDITDLRTAQQALVASELRSRAIVETAVNAIITMSAECILETVNSAAERLFGYTKEEMIGQNISMLMPQPYRDHHDSYVQNYLRTGVKKIIGIGREAVAQRKDGSIFPIDLSVGEVMLPGGKRVFTGIIRDLSDRKALEDKILSISEEEQNRIGQDIHDDLCQQLAAIGCLAKVVHRKLSHDQRHEAVGVDEIGRLVTQANVRAREMSRGLMPVVLDSGGLMAALADLAQSTERIFRIPCPYRCDTPVEVTDSKAAVQIFRIAQEALANAIKHSHATRIEITLSANGGTLALSIKDNGLGIPDNISGKRTGMGLLTMTHRARMIGGDLEIEAGPTGGTLVRCRFPLTHPPASSPE